MSQKNRIIWIDLCKFIAIFYMVWGHTGFMPPNILIYISSFFMPIFFFLSGYVFDFNKNSNFNYYLIKKIKTLIIPYLFFGIIACLYCLIFINQQSALTTLIAMFTVSSINFGQSQALWFLPCIFFTELIFYLIVSRVKKSKQLLTILLVFSVLGYFCKMLTNLRLVFSIDIALTAIVFYGFGYIVRNSKKINELLLKASTKLSLILLLFVGNYILSIINGFVDMRNLVYNNYFLFYISSIIGILSYILLFNYISKFQFFINGVICKVLLYFGKNTLIILVLNEIIISFYRSKGFLTSNSITISGMMIAFFTMITFIPLIYTINKYLPFVTGRPNISNTIK